MKKSRVLIALFPILILICVPIQNQNLPEEETHDSVSQLLRLQKIEDLEITDFIEKENQESFVSTSLADTSNSENKPQKAVLLGGKGINKAINSIQGVTAYVESSPIEILNNSAFGPTGYNFNGNGQSDNPFQITGYNITDSSTTLIHIENTTVYFRIASNTLDGFGGNHDGIYLDNVTNGLIENNTICNIRDGLGLLHSCNYNNITNNVIFNCGRGISLSSSDNNTIWNNTINDASYTGDITLYSSNYNKVLNNTVYNAYTGIILDGSSRYNILSTNTIFNHTSQGIRVASSSNNNSITENTIYNITDNTGSGSGIYMTSSHNNTLSGNTIYNITDSNGITLSSSTYNTLHDNAIFECYMRGISLVSSSHNNTLSGNTIYNCTYDAIYLVTSDHNTLTGNVIYNCSSYGISLVESYYNSILGNTIYNNSWRGIDLEESSNNNTISYNNVYNNTDYGLFFDSSPSANNTITWNNFLDNNAGGTSQAFDSGSDNIISYNYWNEWTSPDVLAPYGIVDIWYNLLGTTNNNDTSPLTTPVIPTVLILSPVSQDYGTDTIIVTLSGFVEHYWYYITGDINNQTWTESEVRTLTDGTYTLHAYGNDTLGNTAHISFTFTIDTTPPVISITSPTNSTTYNQNNVTLIYTVSDGTVTIYLNGYANDTAIPSGTTVTDIPDGSYNLTIISVDQTGNIRKVTILGTIDTPPSSSLSTTSKNGSFPGIFTLVIFFTLPVVVIRRYRRKKKK